MPRGLALLFVLALVAGCAADRPPADVVYTNGRIYTVDESQPWVEAVAITDGKFSVVGSAAEAEAVTDSNTQVVDLNGAMAMPGIIDLHVHPFTTPLFNIINLEFSDPTDPDLMMQELAEFASAHPEKEWIRGGSWGVGVFPDDNPSKDLIDVVVPDRPVVLIDQTGYSYWLNTRALELSGITSETPTDELTIIETDPLTGDPTGTVRENGLRLVEQVAEQPTDAEYSTAFRGIFGDFNSVGVTSMQTGEGNVRVVDAVKILEDAGELTIRLYVAWDWDTDQATPSTDEDMDAQIAGRARYASDMVNPNFVKIFTDGAPAGYGARFLEPYGDGSGNYGSGKLTAEELRDAVVAFDAQGIGTFMHAMGDYSARIALDAIEAAREINGNTGVRHKVAHLAWVDPADIQRFATIPDVAGEISPALTYPSPALESFIPLLGEERVQRTFAARSLIAAGARIGYGSDWLTLIPLSPWQPMQGFVTRINPDFPEMGELGTNETLTVEEAIRVFTINGAYAVGDEDRIGSIEVGKAADMIVLDRNLLEIDATDIRNVQVVRTLVNGVVVYEGGR